MQKRRTSEIGATSIELSTRDKSLFPSSHNTIYNNIFIREQVMRDKTHASQQYKDCRDQCGLQPVRVCNTKTGMGIHTFKMNGSCMIVQNLDNPQII